MAPISFGVRTPLRLVRLKMDDAQTIRDVKGEVAKDSGVAASNWIISLTQKGDVPLDDPTPLAALGINGKLLYGTVRDGVVIPGLPTAADAAAPFGSATASSAAATAGKSGGAAGGGAAGGAGGRPGTATPTPVSGAAATATSTAGSASATGAAGAEKKPERKLTSRCQHGPHGGCQYCTAASYEEMKDAKENATINRTTVERHKERSSKAGDLTGDLEWMCRHRPDQMCINCQPLHKGDPVKLEMLCQHGPDAKCINCLPPDSVVEGRSIFTYDEFLEKTRDTCKHAPGAQCFNCMPPSDHRYKLKSGCSKHRPWPYGICLDCQPEDAYMRRQGYRHVDYIAVNATGDLKSIIDLVSLNAAANVQRTALLYGTYAPDTNYRHGMRAVVQASYEPPQSYDYTTGAVSLLPDPKEPLVNAVAKAAGLVPIGWLFTRKESMKTYNTPILPHELYAIAAAQLKHSPRADGRPGSQWITVAVTRAADSGLYEPKGYMASDQLVALVRDNALAPPKPTDATFNRRVVRKGTDDLPAPDLIEADMLRGNVRKDQVIPEFTWVSMEVGGSATPATAATTATVGGGAAGGGAAGGAGSSAAATAAATLASGVTETRVTQMKEKSKPLFAYADFPRANREMFGVNQDPVALKRYLQAHGSGPWEKRLSDFNLLIYIGMLLDLSSAEMTAKAVATGTPVPDGVTVLLEAIAAAV